ncbi:MAG: Na+/H+ antiporter [Acidobacteria bacterium]|nr:Na+/H+ antiporter [Acidobacteriota bacterium]
MGRSAKRSLRASPGEQVSSEVISASIIVELLLLLLLAVSAVALLTSRWKVPYTIALVFAGFAIDLFHVPIKQVTGQAQLLTPDVIFVLFLPALLFESSLNIEISHLRENARSIVLLAVVGVAAATAITGYVVHHILGLPVLTALLFGALIRATDPIAVIALFKDLGVSKRLGVIVEGESLFNNGTAAVAFQLILAGILTNQFDAIMGIRQFVIVAFGGALLGLVVGYAASKITEMVDEPRIEITLTTIVAYGSYLLAEHLRVSGVMATVLAGLTVGNYGAHKGMSPRTRVAVWSFWEYVAFLVNSLVFLLIGIEVHVAQIFESWQPILLAIDAVLLGRVLVVYGLSPLSGWLGEPIPAKWNPVMVWGGLHGSVSIALALSLPQDFPHRATLLTLCFGVVAFSIVVQALTMKPLLGWLGVVEPTDHHCALEKAKQLSTGAARAELDQLHRSRAVSPHVFAALSQEADHAARELENRLAELQAARPALADEEVRQTRLRMLAAGRATLQRAIIEGSVAPEVGELALGESAAELDRLRRNERGREN